MPPPRRVALMFDLDRADLATRQMVAGIHRWAAEHPGRWAPVHDPFARHRLPGDFAGLIARTSYRLTEALRGVAIPYVLVSARGATTPGHRVMENARAAGTLAARHLVERGYDHFGYVGLHYVTFSRLLETGFKQALRKAHQGFHIIVHHAPRRGAQATPKRWNALTANLGRWLDELPKPVGIFACRDVFALYLAELCREKGLHIPTDVGLIGAGNDPAVCLGAPAALTSIDFDREAVGYQAAALLDQLMASHEPEATPQAEGPPAPPTPATQHPIPVPTGRSNVLIPPMLVPRASTCRDELYADTLVADALAYIERRCHLPLRVADVARAIGMMPRQLLRRFQHIRSRSIVQEITRARLRRARDILQFTDLPVEAVARAVGFKGGRHLTRLFREHHGMTPAAWRRGRPSPPPCDPLDVARAKWYLESTGLSVALIARVCGFRSQTELAAAFHRREGVTPGTYRSRLRHVRPVPGAAAPPVATHFDGPDIPYDPAEVFARAHRLPPKDPDPAL